MSGPATAIADHFYGDLDCTVRACFATVGPIYASALQQLARRHVAVCMVRCLLATATATGELDCELEIACGLSVRSTVESDRSC